ncbi:MAG: formyltetrahydrofolate deformylase [Bacteroidales bacterium]
MKEKKNIATLIIYCPDKLGIVSVVTEFLYKNGGNILYLDQHVDHQEKVFFMRARWELDGFLIPAEKIGDYFHTLIGQKYSMTWELSFNYETPRMAVFVSKLPHCLYDILARYKSGEWDVEIPLIISNHTELKHIADSFGIDFYFSHKNNDNKYQQEQKELEVLSNYKIDFVVLARYMQILSKDFVDRYPSKIINIHHSFLPAFPGAKPYHSAYERGVKLIGATGHYVTSELDAGPIIAQSVIQVNHKDTIETMIRKGFDVEKIVLSKAIEAHLERRTLVYNNRTVVFE